MILRVELSAKDLENIIKEHIYNTVDIAGISPKGMKITGCSTKVVVEFTDSKVKGSGS
jgi:hypothetical protein